MDATRKYVTISCDVCGDAYSQQKRVYDKALWKNRCRLHRKDMAPKKAETNWSNKSGKCEDCGVQIWKQSKRCKACHNRGQKGEDNTCLDCGVVIHRSATRCKPCADKKQTIHGENRGRFQASKAWAETRVKAFIRDKRTCQACGYSGVDIQAHHIKRYCDYPDLRLELDNLVTLCVGCHNKVHAKDVGSNRKNSKLVESDVSEIHKLLEGGMSQASIGKLFGVSQGTIQSIKAGRTWLHVKKQ